MKWLLILVAMGRVTHADPAAEANQALQAFVDAALAKKLPANVDAFIAPVLDQEHAIADLDDLASIVANPKLEIVATHVAKSGTAAWIVAQIAGATYESALKTVTAPLRASAFLTLDGGAWHVRAAHISGGKPNGQRDESCGLIDPAYRPPPQIAKGAEPAVRVITDAFVGQYEGKGTSPHVIPALSDDKIAQMFGSAPNENVAGGAAIKKIFKAWTIDLYADQGERTRAGIASGGDLAWVAMDVTTLWLCTSYRVLFVLQKEGAGWKIVHQHYSEGVSPPFR